MNGRRDESPHRTRLIGCLRPGALFSDERGDIGGQTGARGVVGAVVVAANLSRVVDEEEVRAVEDGDLGGLARLAIEGELGSGGDGVDGAGEEAPARRLG